VAKCSPGQSSSRNIATATASDDKVRIDLDGKTVIIVPDTTSWEINRSRRNTAGCSASVRPS
jgi:hypothetical protein